MTTAARPATSVRPPPEKPLRRPITNPIAPTRISSSDRGSGCHGAWGRSPAARESLSAPPMRSVVLLDRDGAVGRVRCRRRPPLARPTAAATVALGHGASSRTGVCCAASTSIVAPILQSMSTLPSPATPANGGIPGSGLAGPFPVGEYAAALRSKLRSFTRVQLVGELVNLRPARARVYFELRDPTG